MILLNKFNRFEKDSLSEKDVNNLVNIREATMDDARIVTEFFLNYPEVSFCSWQGEHETKNMINNKTSVVILAHSDNILIGVALGGVLGSRATINHLAVNHKYRNNGVANKILEYAQKNIKEKGVKRIFLFVDSNNKPGMNFWKKQGFYETYGEVTMEKDI